MEDYLFEHTRLLLFKKRYRVKQKCTDFDGSDVNQSNITSSREKRDVNKHMNDIMAVHCVSVDISR